jgi:hypothetical protein
LHALLKKKLRSDDKGMAGSCKMEWWRASAGGSVMKTRRWHAVLIGIACLLIVVGVAPLAYLLWQGGAHNLEPVSMPISLKRGEYASPFFTTDLDDDYQVDIYFLPFRRTPLDLDWKVVDDTGKVIQSGSFSDHRYPGGNNAILGHYRPKRGLRQRVVVNIHQDVQTPDLQAPGSDIRLHVGLPERGLERAYGSAAAIGWAAIVGGAGTLMLLVLLIMRAIRREAAVVVC